MPKLITAVYKVNRQDEPREPRALLSGYQLSAKNTQRTSERTVAQSPEDNKPNGGPSRLAAASLLPEPEVTGKVKSAMDLVPMCQASPG